MRYTAFDQGRIVPDQIVDNLIALARAGYVGKDLLLVPDTRYGRSDESGLRKMRPVKRDECIWLSSIRGN